MALLHLNYMSMTLRGNTDVNIILPDCEGEPKTFYESGVKYPVLWLLHGTFGDYTDWVRMTSIERYAKDKKIVVVMPSSLNSMYVNWNIFAMGYNAYDNLMDELMPMARETTQLLALPADKPKPEPKAEEEEQAGGETAAKA